MTLEPLPFIKEYIRFLNLTLKEQDKSCELTITQGLWLGFCLMGILMTNSICWEKFERLSLKNYTKQAISWIFRHSKIKWDLLLVSSVKVILRKYHIEKGILVVDDKDINRSKNAKKLYRLHKMRDKKSGGYHLGQNVIFLYLVTEKISLPVGFKFYAPDSLLKKWQEENKKLKKQKVPKSKRPRALERLPDYPKKFECALALLKDFKDKFLDFKVTAILADCLYGHRPFIEGVEGLWKSIQVITKMRKNQNICYRNREYSCGKHFSIYKGWNQTLLLRGREEKKVIAGGSRLYVPSHEQKRFVIALKYDSEIEYRYLMASNLSWTMKEIINTFTLRWLIEVFFEDWSCYQGFCNLAKQCGVEGSERPLILSLLFDHCFFFYPQQQLNIEKQVSLATFGSLIEKAKIEAFYHFIEQILEEDSPKEKLKSLMDQIDDIFVLRPSKKHLNGVSIQLEPDRLVA